MNFCTDSPRRGQLMVNESGVTGVVTHEIQYFNTKAGKYDTRYFGVNFNGNEWESFKPKPLAANMGIYIRYNYTNFPRGFVPNSFTDPD